MQKYIYNIDLLNLFSRKVLPTRHFYNNKKPPNPYRCKDLADRRCLVLLFECHKTTN